MKLSKLVFVFSVLHFSQGLQAQTDLPSYTPPSLVEVQPPQYPPTERRRGQEGWVGFNFRVNEQGKAYSPTIIESSGSEAFHGAARRALNDSKWTPATEKGNAVDGSASIIFRFELPGAPREIRLSFKEDYEQLMGMINAGDKETATALLADIESSTRINNFESALLSLVRYNYMSEFGGGDLEKMANLSQALAYEAYSNAVGGAEDFLAPELEVIARQNILMLQVNNRQYGEALRTYERLLESNVDVSTFSNAIDEIKSLQQSDSSYALKGVTNEFGYWQLALLKPGVYIDSVEANIEEVNFQCQNKFQAFQFQEGVEYKIPASWGRCEMYVKGKPNVEFDIELFKE